MIWKMNSKQIKNCLNIWFHLTLISYAGEKCQAPKCTSHKTFWLLFTWTRTILWNKTMLRHYLSKIQTHTYNLRMKTSTENEWNETWTIPFRWYLQRNGTVIRVQWKYQINEVCFTISLFAFLQGIFGLITL